jgi:tetratricopeptide (TPR) repeat protein
MKRTFLAVLLSLVAGPTIAVCQSQLDHVKQLLNQKQTAEAISACHSYLQTNQRDENGWLLLAKAFQQAGELDSAEVAGKKTIDLDDELLDGYTVLAQVQLAKKNWRQAYETIQTGLKTIPKGQPKYAPLVIELGWCYLAADSVDQALIAGSLAKELEPKSAVAYDIIGLAYFRQGVTPMAVSSFEKSLEIDSLQPVVLFELANTYEKDRQYTEAARVYLELLKLQPDNDPARLKLAELFFKARQYAKCAAVLREYFKTHKNPPKDKELMFLEALFRSRQFTEAANIAARVLETDPNSSIALRAVAYGYLVDKKYQKAVDTYKKLAEVDTLEYDDYLRLGQANKQIKKDSLALEAFEGALKLDSTQAFLYGEIAAILMNQEQWERAADYFMKRYELDTASTASLVNYALCKMQVGKNEQASEALQKAIAQNPKYAPSYYYLGLCYFSLKDNESARREFENTIKIADTAEAKYRFELAGANRMIGIIIMIEKHPPEESPQKAQKRWEDAIVYLKRSLKLKEDVAQTHVLLGQCYQNLNKRDEAIKEYERAKKLDPKNKEAIKGLEVLRPE